jgi:hypothetical protein
MLTDSFPFLLAENFEPNLSAKLRLLADDLERVAARKAPSRAVLDAAPILSAWRCVWSPLGLRLEGRVVGHPRLGDAHVLTSPIWAAPLRSGPRMRRIGGSGPYHASTCWIAAATSTAVRAISPETSKMARKKKPVRGKRTARHEAAMGPLELAVYRSEGLAARAYLRRVAESAILRDNDGAVIVGNSIRLVSAVELGDALG